MTTQDPPNGWQLDKDVSLVRQDVQRLSVQVADLTDTVQGLRDEMIAERTRRKTFVLIVSFLSSTTAMVATWAKMAFWGHQ